MSAASIEAVLLAHQRIPLFDGTQGQRCVGCDHLRGETDGPNSPRHAAHVAAVIRAEALPALLAEAKAEAWDDGYDAGDQDARAVQPNWPTRTFNPYRGDA